LIAFKPRPTVRDDLNVECFDPSFGALTVKTFQRISNKIKLRYDDDDVTKGKIKDKSN